MSGKIFAWLLITVLLIAFSSTEAQQPKKVPRIGFLSTTSPTVAASQTEAFREALNQLGYTEGENIALEWRYAEGKRERLPELAAELVRLNVDVIVTGSTPAIRAVQQATKAIPIVMTNVGDPVAEGFVVNLARPGGNITGFTNLSPDLSTKRLELIKDIAPKISRVVVFSNAAQHGPALKNMEA